MPLFEIAILRCDFDIAEFSSPAAVIDAAKAAATAPFAHPAKQRIGADDWHALADLLTSLTEALAPLTALDRAHDLLRWIDAHRHALDMIARGDSELSTGFTAGDEY